MLAIGLASNCSSEPLPSSLDLQKRFSGPSDMDILYISSLHLELHSSNGRGGSEGLPAQSAIEGPALLHHRSVASGDCRTRRLTN